MATISYFAYGSNMLEERLRRRCPSARAAGKARLPGWILTLHKRSKDGSGKATLEPAGDQLEATAYGVLFEIDDSDLEVLDRAEGHGKGYDRRSVEVVKESSGAKANAITYLADAHSIDRNLRPYDWYLALIIAGAREHRLPEAYVETLRNAPSIPDPEPERESKLSALALIEEASKS